jgi:hypothetical protein
MKTTMEILTKVSNFIPTVGLVFIMSRFAEKIGELREAIKPESLAFRDLWQPPVDLDYDYRYNYREENRVHKQRLDALLRKYGTSPEQLRKIGSESDERLREILCAADGTAAPGYNLPENLGQCTSLSPLHKFPIVLLVVAMTSLGAVVLMALV